MEDFFFNIWFRLTSRLQFIDFCLFLCWVYDWVYCNITVICGAPYLDSPLPQFLQKKEIKL